MAKSMNGQSNLFDLTTFEDSSSAISSPASADGRSHSDSPDGTTQEAYGQAVAPVSRSQARVTVKAAPMRATFGRRGFGSSQSAALSRSLVNKLKARLRTDGSIVFAMTWKEKATPLGRSVCLLRASARSISDSGSGSWPTPTTRDHKDGSAESCQNVPTNALLGRAVHLATWPTPVVNDTNGSGYCYSSRDHSKIALKLPGAARLVGWPTPDKSSGDGGLVSSSDFADATETYNEAGDTMSSRKTRLLVSGPMLNGSHAQTGSSGQLNPAHSRWLMGYPPEWDDCAVTAMPSSRKSQPK